MRVSRLLLGLGLIAAALLLGALVADGAPPAIDAAVAKGAQDAIGPWIGEPLRATSRALRSPWHWIAAGMFALLALALRGHRAALVVALAAVASMFATRGLKDVFERQRPTPDLVGERSHDSKTSYPSGHVVWAAAAFGSLAFVLAERRRRATAAALYVFAFAAVAWFAAGRIYLGRHYLTDTVGSVLLAAGFVCAFAALLKPR